MGRNGVKTRRIYIKLYMSIFIRKNLSYPPIVFLSETLYFELPKNLVICFMGTFSVIVARYYKKFPKLSTSFKLKAMNFTVATKTAILWKPPESTQNHLQAPKTIHNHSKPSTQKHLQSPETNHHHSKPSTISQSLPRTSSNWSETIHI